MWGKDFEKECSWAKRRGESLTCIWKVVGRLLEDYWNETTERLLKIIGRLLEYWKIIGSIELLNWAMGFIE